MNTKHDDRALVDGVNNQEWTISLMSDYPAPGSPPRVIAGPSSGNIEVIAWRVVRLISSKSEVELVQCKKCHKPVGEPEVRNLAGAMVHENAVRGFILAPGGFSQSARRWAIDKRIVLADEAEIGKMVESVYGIR